MTEPLHIGVSIDGAGQHPGAWREPRAHPDRLFSAQHFIELARLAERGSLDFVTLSDSFRLQSDRADNVRGQLDALLTMARIAPATRAIGLLPTVTTTHTEPFHVAKNLATLDFVSLGRAGWLVDVSTTEAEAFHFGRRTVADADELYAEASEAVDVVAQLWDSWEDDAVIRDVATGRYVDRSKLHVTNFEGRFFSVRGPSITPRSPQGQSVVAIEAVDDHALAVGVERADIIVVRVASIDAATSLRRRIVDGLAASGRDPATVTVLAVVDVLLADSDDAARSLLHRLDDNGGPRSAPVGLDHVGTASALIERFAAWAEAGAVDGFLVRPATLPATLQRFVDDVVPSLQRRGLFRDAYAGATFREHLGLDRPPNRYALDRTDAVAAGNGAPA
ncbi:MAG: class flavin-dependent oxidoreductase [Ilumatobacteraceae bacterium]|nr:class flavin-dependent oxidoreductase [Ilumatobacteraceae bacterium]